ncbi:hypothetical protein G9U51_06590 [Calidifontibacter sp. DB0510]|uniref:HTH luxR-type domain-containing protein n=1 Tax=Metallococcus carri TaxID=1656884 RepID=A0A967B1B2_9MICO|nr:helix-turn-helix domain-containing protein [Metallococcus carri]NHN55450.1 hypothetical protein [Metallococcus carri]NOP38366.1 hypothetical protein [Calidifontibacter sp. DB2511S]
MDGRLTVLGLGPDGEALYRQVLRMPGEPLAAHAHRIGCSLTDAEAALADLQRLRLVRVGDDGVVSADHPRAALERVVSIEEAQLATRRQQLARVRDSIDAFAADYRVGQERSSSTVAPRERVDAAVVAAVREQLMASTDGTVRVAVRTVPAERPSDLPGALQQVHAGREQRALYLESIVDAAGDWMREWADAGEQQRVTKQLPSEFVCFGTECALATTEWGRADGDFVVLRDPMVVAAFVELFDRVWQTAAVVDTGATEESLLQLMRQGLKDEAIARVLGVSLRTVRRRIATLMAEHQVDTRFQLALELARREGDDATRPDDR